MPVLTEALLTTNFGWIFPASGAHRTSELDTVGSKTEYLALLDGEWVPGSEDLKTTSLKARSPDAPPAEEAPVPTLRRKLDSIMERVQATLKVCNPKKLTPIILACMDYAVIDSILSGVVASRSAPATFDHLAKATKNSRKVAKPLLLASKVLEQELRFDTLLSRLRLAHDEQPSDEPSDTGPSRPIRYWQFYSRIDRFNQRMEACQGRAESARTRATLIYLALGLRMWLDADGGSEDEVYLSVNVKDVLATAKRLLFFAATIGPTAVLLSPLGTSKLVEVGMHTLAKERFGIDSASANWCKTSTPLEWECEQLVWLHIIKLAVHLPNGKRGTGDDSFAELRHDLRKRIELGNTAGRLLREPCVPSHPREGVTYEPSLNPGKKQTDAPTGPRRSSRSTQPTVKRRMDDADKPVEERRTSKRIKMAATRVDPGRTSSVRAAPTRNAKALSSLSDAALCASTEPDVEKGEYKEENEPEALRAEDITMAIRPLLVKLGPLHESDPDSATNFFESLVRDCYSQYKTGVLSPNLESEFAEQKVKQFQSLLLAARDRGGGKDLDGSDMDLSSE